MTNTAFSASRYDAAKHFDAVRIRDALFVSNGVVRAAARALQLSPHYLYARAKLVGVDIPAIRAELDAARSAAPALPPAP